MTLSPRLRAIVDALPLEPGMRVLEIGCGPGAAAREVAARVGPWPPALGASGTGPLGPGGFVLATDRSERAIAQVVASSEAEIAAGVLGVRCVAAEGLVLLDDEAPYDLAFAVRVGAFDGRFPAVGEQALARLRRVLVPGARLHLDGTSTIEP